MEKPALRRIYYICQLIERGKYPNAPRLARDLEVNQRTIERDIEYIREQLGAALEYDPRRRGYRFSRPFSLPPVQFTEQELVGILLAHRLLERYLATPHEKAVRRAIEKICLLLPSAVSVESADLERLMSFEVQPLRGEEERVASLVAALNQAAEEGRSLDVLYYTASRDDVGWRRIDPYHLRLACGAWYLIGFCHRRGEVRIFALHRIREWRYSGERFERPRDFSVESYLGLSWSLVRGEPRDIAVLFEPRAARYVREQVWHSTQTLEELPDGRLVWRARVGGLDEVKRWVLMFGAEACVLAPPELEREVATEAVRLAERYGRRAGEDAARSMGSLGASAPPLAPGS